MRKYLVGISLILLLMLYNKVFGDYVVIVIDTSLSMNRRVIDNQRLYDIALKSLSNAIFSLRKGDIIYVADFNEKTYIRSPIQIKDDHTKEVIVKLMYGIQPYGNWTFTYQMLKDISTVLKTNNLPPEKSRVIIISDGIDDPPIKSKKYFLELEKVSTMFESSQLIYYISLEKLIKDEEVKGKSSIKEKIIKDSKISVIEVEKPEEVGKAIEEKVIGGFRIRTEHIIVLSLLILAVLAILFISNLVIISISRKKSDISKIVCISGKVKRSFTIPALKKKIVIAQQKGYIKLKDWNYEGLMVINSSLSGYRILLTDISKVISPFKNKEVITKGYKIVVSNYMFEFE